MSNDGKSAEDYIREALKLLEKTKQSTFIRLYDSRSAGFGKGGGIIPEQPSDFIFTVEGLTSLLEVKSSEKYNSLKETTLRNVFSDNQMLGAKLWTRAGASALVAFHSAITGRFEIWPTMVIRESYYAPPRHRKLSAIPIIGSTPDAFSLCYALEFSIKHSKDYL